MCCMQLKGCRDGEVYLFSNHKSKISHACFVRIYYINVNDKDIIP
jgi:hypothetical protein